MNRFNVFVFASAIALSNVLVSTANASTDCEPLIANDFVVLDPNTFEFQGFTKEAITQLKGIRDALRQRCRVFDNQFMSLGSMHHAATVALCGKVNMFLYGPPGGAKSAVVKWLFEGEKDPAFQLQLHQMMTEQAFVGGQSFAKAQEGEFEINTKGSLADFKVALIDEAEKGNPAALSALLSLLNEREILAGNKVVKANIETIFATSNANLPEIFKHFVSNGQGTTAAAFLNRFQVKGMVYNWLSTLDQATLDERRQKARYLNTIKKFNPKASQNDVFAKPETIDWDVFREFSNILFRPSPRFLRVFREFVNEMRVETNRAVRESEEKHSKNKIAEPFIYFPSFDFTERLRQQIPDLVIMSAMIDFLLSDLANDENLERYASQTIELGPLSMWRSYLLLTTIGPGETKLVYDESSDTKIKIDFEFKIDESNARDARELLLIHNLKEEQNRFQRVFSQQISKLQETLKWASTNALTEDGKFGNFDYFELQMLKK